MKYYFTCFMLVLCTNNYLSGQLYINEIIASNDTILADNNGEYDDIIEIYNAGNTPVDMAGYYLSDDLGDPLMWQIPATDAALTTVPAGGYLIFWADDETAQGANHTNFKLSSSGESVVLTAPDGTTMVDALTFSGTIPDRGYGRLPDGSANLSELTPASPAATNDNSQPQIDKPVISPESGLYTGAQTISISASTGATIYYTTDGSVPTLSDAVYTAPFQVDTVLSVRAIAVKNGFANSFVTTNTYLVDFTSSLPIFHITMDSIDLWSDTAGIYVSGTNGITGYCDNAPRNWNQDWEKPAHLKIFKEGELVAENNIGVKIGGNCKRKKPQKPLNIYFRDEYSDTGDNALTYPIFPDNDISYFKRLFVRSGNNNIAELFRDLVAARTVQDKFEIDVQSGQPIIVFLNGKYVGIQNLREKLDKWHYEQDFKNVKDTDSVDVIKNPGRYDPVRWWPYHRATHGDTLAWRTFINHMKHGDFTSDSSYQEVQKLLAKDELINYLTAGDFFVNHDWIPNNQKTWRENGNNAKWRWCMIDFDSALNPSKVAQNQLNNILQGYGPNNVSSYETNIIYHRLFANETFKAEYIQRMATYLELVYTNEVFDPIIDAHYNEMLPDLPRAMALYNHTIANYEANIANHKNFVAQRTPYARNHIKNYFGLSDSLLQVNFNFDNASNGTVALHANYFDLPFDYTGTYFKDVPMQIHAIPNPGYRFVEWQETGDTNAYLYQSFSDSLNTLTPIFEAALDVVINEIHYNPNEQLDPLYDPNCNCTETPNLNCGLVCNTLINFEDFENGWGIWNSGGANSAINNNASYAASGSSSARIRDNTNTSVITTNSIDLSSFTEITVNFSYYPVSMDNSNEDFWLQISTDGGSTFNTVQTWAQGIDFNNDTRYTETVSIQSPLTSNTQIRFRCDASGIEDYVYLDDIQLIGCSDICSTSACDDGTPCTDIEKEFIEIYNPDSKARDLSGYEFSEGICFKFPKGTSIAAGEYIIIAADATQYLANGYQVFQWNDSKLNNNGEALVLQNPLKTNIDTVRYNDGIPWALLADGFGASLELDYPLPADNIAPTDWHASAPTGGTPGAQNSTPCTTPTEEIVINEINYNSDNTNFDASDWVELHNPTASDIDISGWGFYDSENTFTIPAGTILAADEFLILTEDAALFSAVFPHLNVGQYIGDLGFGLSNGGERVSLFDQNKCLVDELKYDDEMQWDSIPDGNGPTLSLITPSSDNTLPQSWEASTNINSLNGTPGRANTPCLENTIVLPGAICAGFPAEIRVDSAYSDMDFTWFASGATPTSFTVDSDSLTWNNPGTFNAQLITKYYECTKVYTQPITVENCNTIPNIIDDNFSTNEDNMLSDNVLSNDSDPDFNGLIVNTTPQIDVTNGTLILNADGTFDYTPNPNFYGTDSFTYEVCDDATYDATSNQFVGQVTASGDDVEELLNGTIETTSSDLDMMEDSPDVYTAMGIRIKNIAVPQGATITGAYLEFVADEAQSVATSLNISAAATGNAAAIPTTNFALSSMTKTNATATWANLPAWTIGNTYQSADISPVVQELINRGDWATGNAMTFIIEGTGRRTAESFDGVAAPKLVITYGISQIDVSLCDAATVFINILPQNDAPQATNDNLTTTEDTPKTDNAVGNDSDIDGDNLALNITPIIAPQNGSLFLLAGGSYSYTPDADFFGTDTFEYEICDDGNPIMCDTASVFITVNPVNDAPASAPDTLYMFANSSIQDNILLNDNDIENDNLTAVISPMAVPINGTVIIQPNGNIDYTPNANFVGTDSFTYEVCDDGTPSMCNTETVLIVIDPDCVDIELAAWLEGAFDPALGEMRNVLVATRKLLPGQTPTSGLATPTPAGQPYSAAPWNYAGTEGASWTDADYTGDETDWVLVSFRTDIQKSTEVGMTAALLMKDGSITFPDRCALTSTVASPLYIVVEHRNHIGVMSPQPVNLVNSTLTYDFRSSESYRDQTSFGQKQLPTGEWTMFAGDADQSDFPSYDIQGTDKTIWFENNGVFDYYFSPDFNLDGDINGQDKSLWFENNGISSRVPK